MKSQDSEFAAWLKTTLALTGDPVAKETASADLIRLRRTIGNQGILDLIDRLKVMATSPAPEVANPEKWFEAIKNLVGFGYLRSAHMVAIARMAALAEFELARVIPILPDEQCIEAWRKVRKLPVTDLAKELIADPASVYPTATADWLLAHGRPQVVVPLLRVFLSQRPRAKHLLSWDKALSKYLEKDPKAERLAAAIEAAEGDTGLLALLAGAVRESTLAMSSIAIGLTRLAEGKAGFADGPAFVRCLFSKISSATGKERRHECADLALVSAHLLHAPKPTPVHADMLAVVAEISAEIRNLTRSEHLKSETWVVEPLSQPLSTEDTYLTLDGARRWAISYENALRGGEGVVVLEVLGYNLGLRKLGEKGIQVSYTPKAHEDTEGGILPGDPVTVVAHGWSFRDHPIVRAKVRRAEGK